MILTKFYIFQRAIGIPPSSLVCNPQKRFRTPKHRMIGMIGMIGMVGTNRGLLHTHDGSMIHGAGIYANMTGVYGWDPCYHIYPYIAYMDPMGYFVLVFFF